MKITNAVGGLPPEPPKKSVAQASSEANPGESYQNLTPDERQECHQKIQELARRGRLFRPDAQGHLVRATALTAFRALQEGQPLEDVTVCAESTSQHHKTSSESFYQDYYSGFNTASSVKKSSQDRTVVDYISSPIQGFGDLLWVELGAEGVPGSQELPRIGSGSVTTSQQEAADWQRNHHYYELNRPELLTRQGESDSKSQRLSGT